MPDELAPVVRTTPAVMAVVAAEPETGLTKIAGVLAPAVVSEVALIATGPRTFSRKIALALAPVVAIEPLPMVIAPVNPPSPRSVM